MTIKDVIMAHLTKGAANGILPNRRGDNLGPVLGEIFYWQETKKIAEELLKSAWKDAQDQDLLPIDDVLREDGESEERILVESNNFSVVVKVDKPREVFSRDKFIATVARKFKLDPDKLEAIAKTCVTPSAAPLKKRVLEV